ncbi:MAG: hypothetical protein HUU15_07925 [Candidatus Brocadiae bacterium]|nr:hypothetical protein [Candidatus Brocadiia bacterium]
MKPLVRLLALLTLPFAAGCFETDQKTTLYPDGSGKLVWTIGIKVDKGDEDPVKEEKIDEMAENTEGIVAWAEPRIAQEDGWVKVTLVAYFEDINAVKFRKEGSEDELMLSYKYVRNGDGGTLAVNDAMSKDMKPRDDKKDEPQDPEAKKFAEEMAKQMREAMKGMRLAVSVKVPGAVTEAGGWNGRDGRTASLVIDDKMIFEAEDDPEAKKKLEALGGSLTVTWAKNEVPAAELAEFRNELAAAKAAWEKRKAEKAGEKK